MDAKRMEEIKGYFGTANVGESSAMANELVSEIERLKGDNRRLLILCDERQARAMIYLNAYEVLERAMNAVSCNSKDAATILRARGSLEESQRIINS